MLLDAPPPSDLDAEQSVLGSCLLDPAALESAAEELQPHDFYAERNQRIFEVMLAIRPKAVDLVTVSEELKRRGWLDGVGGISHLASLATAVPTTANVGAYADIVRHKARLRRAIKTCCEALDRLPNADADDLDHIAGLLSLAIDDGPKRDFEDIRLLGDVAAERVALLRQSKPGTMQGTKWGYRSIDYIVGGFLPGEIYVIGGRPAMGKTGFSLDVVRHNAKDTGKPWLFASLEMSEERLADRQVLSLGRIDGTRYQRIMLNPTEWDQAARAAQTLKQIPFYVSGACLTLEDIRNRARWMRSQNGSLGGIAVDYLQLVNGSQRDRKQNRQEEVAGISRGLKHLSVELECPVLALSQLSRLVEQRPDKRPTMADLRESGAIEQDAALVALLYRDDYYAEQAGRAPEKPGIVEVIIAKNRYGSVGTAELKFHPEWQAFDEIERRQESAGPVPGRRPWDG